jgi:hypothetical protein
VTELPMQRRVIPFLSGELAPEKRCEISVRTTARVNIDNFSIAGAPKGVARPSTDVNVTVHGVRCGEPVQFAQRGGIPLRRLALPELYDFVEMLRGPRGNDELEPGYTLRESFAGLFAMVDMGTLLTVCVTSWEPHAMFVTGCFIGSPW